ncbi:MAG: signal recognition particle protein [Candidatus Eremiobacteraeota bacterium]|nr:signal recognition particle protein [Candidatus Eremiobacteraeota bacterium]
MMFESLSERLGAIFKRLTGRGKLNEADINEVMREVRIALLEADVSLSAAKDFVNAVKEKAVGQNVFESLSPAQTIIKIVNDELVDLLGGAQARLQFSDAPPSVVMLVGLQGSGKTTQAAKLALRLKEQGRRSLLVACDIYRPAAIEQLQTLGQQIDLPVYQQADADPVNIARQAVAEAKRLALSTVIVDTAGRLQIDDELMRELERIKAAVQPVEILLVADAMTGQEATNVAKGFHDRLGITGVILTKLDGDARGGAALSIHKVTGAPIKFIGVGEKLPALEPFYPDRLASRILGMGDLLTLIERTQSVYSEAQAKELEQKFARSQFTLDDFLDQLRQVKKMGSFGDIIKMIPGVSRALPKNFEVDESQVGKVEAIICSMTRQERRNPNVLNGSRRKRIALGSGTQVSDVNRLIKQFDEAKVMMRKMGGMRGRLAMASQMRGLPVKTK